MAYSTLDDIKKLLPEKTLILLTDDEGACAVNQGRIEEAVAQADSAIDGYLSVRYPAPFSDVPELLRKLSVDIAVYNLHSRRADEIPPARAERYKNAVRTLTGLSGGSISLGPETSGAETNKETDGNVFTREKLEGF